MAYIKLEDLMAFPIRIDHYDKENGNEHFVYGVETVLEYAENLPVADVAPVVHGRWVVRDGRLVCNQCGALLAVVAFPSEPDEFDKLHSNFEEMFCYKCGARMDGGNQSEQKP